MIKNVEAIRLTVCENCLYCGEDEETGESVCSAPLDMDEAEHFLDDRFRNCPYYTPGDEYTIVKKQN